MPHGSVTDVIPAASADVFRLLHDYTRRLEWDTLLKDACLCEGFTKAGLHAVSICTGHWYLGGIAMKTEYVAFHPPHVAAVTMLNRPPFFEPSPPQFVTRTWAMAHRISSTSTTSRLGPGGFAGYCIR